MTSSLLLYRQSLNGDPLASVNGQPLHAWADRLTATLVRLLGPDAASLLGRPLPTSDGAALDWYWQGVGYGRVVPPPYSAEVRRDLDAFLLEKFEFLRREAAQLQQGRGDEPLEGLLLRLLIDTAALDKSIVVDDRPVLVGWGFGAVDLTVDAAPALGAPMVALSPQEMADRQQAQAQAQSRGRDRMVWAWLLTLALLLAFLPLALLALIGQPAQIVQQVEPGADGQPDQIAGQLDEAAVLAAELAAATTKTPPAHCPAPAPVAKPEEPKPQPPKPEPAKVPPPLPPKPEPPKPEQPKPEPPKPEPAKPEAPKSEPAKPAMSPEASRDLATARAAGAGEGEFEVILAWDNRQDLDLSVVCPSGEEIWQLDMHGCGGELDIDANGSGNRKTRTPVEHIRFKGEPGPGTYRIRVGNCEKLGFGSSYRLTVLYHGQVIRESVGTSAVSDRWRPNGGCGDHELVLNQRMPPH